METVRMAARNVARNRRSYFVGSLMAAGVAIFFVGNSLLDGIDAGIESSFKSSFTADLAVSGLSETGFSVFGDEAPVIGSFSRLPTIVPFDELRAFVDSRPEVAGMAAQVSGFAYMEAGSYREAIPLFGVSGEEYFSLFKGVRITRGRALSAGERGILLSGPRVRRIESSLGRELRIGELIQLSVADDSMFRIRAVPLVGTYSYPIADATLDSIALVDAGTLRSLCGMTLGTPEAVKTSAAETGLLSGSVDDLFSADDAAEGEGAGFSRLEMEAELAAPSTGAAEPAPDSGAWHFLLIRLKPGSNAGAVARSLDASFKARHWPAKARDWRSVAGTSALFAFWLKIIFNAAFAVAAFAALIVIVNSLSISIHERRGEIGTMRALGATKAFVRRLFILETSILSLASGLVGLALGVAASLLLLRQALTLENPFLVQLFGGRLLRPEIRVSGALRGMAMAMSIGVLSWIYPLRLALRIPPVQAMSGSEE